MSLVDWLRDGADASSRGATTGCTSRATTRATCSATRSSRSATRAGRAPRRARRFDDDELLASTRRGRATDERASASARTTERWIASVRLGAVVFAVVQVIAQHGLPAGLRAGRVDHHRALRDRCGDPLRPQPHGVAAAAAARARRVRARLRHGGALRVPAGLQLREREPDPPGSVPRRRRGSGSLRDRRPARAHGSDHPRADRVRASARGARR